MSRHILWLARRQGSLIPVKIDPAKLSTLTDAEFFSCQSYMDQHQQATVRGEPLPATPDEFWKLVIMEGSFTP